MILSAHGASAVGAVPGQGGRSHRALPIDSRLIIAKRQVHNSIEMLNTFPCSKMLLLTLLSYRFTGHLGFYYTVFHNTAALENLLGPVYECVGSFWSLEFQVIHTLFDHHGAITAALGRQLHCTTSAPSMLT